MVILVNFLSVEGAATMADTSVRTLERDVRRGIGPKIEWTGNLRRVRQEEAEAYAERRRQRRA